MLRYGSRRQRRQTNLLIGLLASGVLAALRLEAQESTRWTLAEALEKASSHSPVLRARRAALAEARAGLLAAKTYPYNPELTLELADRSSPGTSTKDRGLSVSQEIEIAGQRRKRVAVASEELAAAEAFFLRESSLLAAQVAAVFAEAVRGRELLKVAQTDAALAREVLGFSQRRLERGAISQIEVNLALASAGRAESSAEQAQAAYLSARSHLAELAGLDPATAPEPLGELALPEGELAPLAELLEAAVEHRGDLRSIRRQEQAAEAAIRLARAERMPNVTIGSFLQREEATDDIFGATVGVGLPLFNRNQGRIAEARASRERLRHEAEALRLAVEQEVFTAVNDLRAARAAAEHLSSQVLGTLEENVDLLQRSFAAGRIGATEGLTLRRELVASRREHIEALADAWRARIALDLATGRLPILQSTAQEEQP